MSIPNNRSSQGLPKRPNQGLPNRPASGKLPNRPDRPNNPRIPNKEDGLPDLPDFNTPNPRSEADIVRSRTRRNDQRPEGVRGKPSDEYNFNTGRAALGQKESFRNEFDNEDDNTFEDISIDDQLNYEIEEDQEARRKAAKRRAADRAREEEIARRRAERQAEREKAREEEILFDAEPEEEEYDEELPESLEVEDDEDEEEAPVPAPAKKQKKKKDFTDDNVKDEYGQDVFIDEKNMKLKPFGTKKSKKKKRTKEHEYDSRKNMRTNSTIARFVFLGIGLVLIGFGAKNTFFPAPALTEDEITGIVAETANLTNYPVERGGGFAKDFVQAYLNTDPEESQTNQSVLNYFYTGDISTDDTAITNRVVSSGYSQSVIYGPTIYESVALTDYSARYTVGAVVRSSSPSPDTPETDAKWIFMNVNVYYDVDTDSFTITPDSPAILPNPPVGDNTNLPTEMPLGEETTDTEVIDKIQPVLYGFLNGYRQSSVDDHSTLDQYIVSNANSKLEQGLNGKYDFAGGTVEDATEYLVYTDAEDPGLLKVKTTVTWVSGAEGNNVNFTSTYVVFLREQSNGMYLVERFQPFYFVADEEAMAAEEAETAETVEAPADAAPVEDEVVEEVAEEEVEGE